MSEFFRSFGFGSNDPSSSAGASSSSSRPSSRQNRHPSPNPPRNGFASQPPPVYDPRQQQQSRHSPAPHASANVNVSISSSTIPPSPFRSPPPPPHAPNTNDSSLLSLADLRTKQADHAHTLSVLESRLSHCFDSGDEQGAGQAAQQIAHEKKVIRDLTQLIVQRERREQLEQKITSLILTKFTTEKSALKEHRRHVDSIKERLRVAFGVPIAPSAASSPSGDSSMMPPPSQTHRTPSPSPGEPTLHDMIIRSKTDLGRYQIALEHQCLNVDSIELTQFVDQANVVTNEGASSSGDVEMASASSGSASSQPGPQALPINMQWSDDLTLYFKSSRKEVVTSLQAVLSDVDALMKSVKDMERMFEFLARPDQP